MALKQISARVLAVALAGALLVPSLAPSAEARDGRHGWGNGGGYKHHRVHRPHRPNYGYRHHRGNRGNDAGAAVAAGVIGLAAGAILGSALSAPDRVYEPEYIYRDPAPVRGNVYIDPANRGNPIYTPAAPVVVGGGLEPYTPEWYSYCASKYRSFNPNTGTYTTYSGQQRFCQ
ncbi:BA14K family protein [Stappia sp. WLB 29]|uniref:BA14K family protein n=1 Tax=Stappia sp. WLB 29 TaxID=2925220 RepID=UPI0020C0F678|nr:BA14K family protein [Stappia sp. WLB 29]